MPNLSFAQHYFFDTHPSAGAGITGFPSTWPNDPALDLQTDSLVPDTSWTPHGNALGLTGMSAPEPDWIADLSTFPSMTHPLNQIDTQLSQLCHPSSQDILRLRQPPVFRIPFISDKEFVGVQEALHSVYPMTLPGRYSIPKSTTRSLSIPRSLRHTPYHTHRDKTKQRASSPDYYPCQWSDGVASCGAVVASTKNAIAQHLRAAHAIRLKADKAIQVCCQWEMCYRPMRRENIARHILAVHMQHKVRCPSCGSRFARMDSLQRHQKTQCLVTEESDPCKAGM